MYIINPHLGDRTDNASFVWGHDLVEEGGIHRANLWQGAFPVGDTGEDGFLMSTAPVDSFGPQNSFGVFNIAGNVWEWVADAWTVQHVHGDGLVDPLMEVASPTESTERTKRGGSYMCVASYCNRYRVNARSHNSADSTAGNLGFRCVK